MGLRQRIEVVLDAAAQTKLAADFRAAGAQGVTALRTEFDKKMADTKYNLAAGFIDEKEFKAASSRIAHAFNSEILTSMDKMKRAGQENTTEYRNLSSQLKTVGDTGVQSSGLLAQGWSKIKGIVGGVGAAIAAAFTVRAVIDFGKAAVAEAIAVQRGWSEVRAAVEQSGASFEGMRGEIERVSNDIAQRFAFDDDEIRAGFTSLVRMTGDVTGSLRNMDVVASLARAGQMSLTQASELLGRAMETGNTRGLVPYVGTLDKSRPIMDQVREKLGDIESTISPMERGTAGLARVWDDLLDVIGRAIISGTEGTDAFTVLTTAVQDLTKWVVDNRVEIAGWISGGINVAISAFKFFGGSIVNTVKEIVAIWTGLQRAWNGLQVDIATGAQMFMGILLKVEGVALKAAERMGLTGVAARIRAEMADASETIGDLGVFIAEKSVAMRRDMGGDDAEATTTASIGGSLAANVKSGTGKAGGDFDTFGARGKKVVKELSDATRTHMREMEAAYGNAGRVFDSQYTGNILAGKTAIVAAHKEMIGGVAELTQTTETLQRANDAAMASYVDRDVPAILGGSAKLRESWHAQRDAMLELQQAVNAGTATYTDDHVPSILQGSKHIDDALHQQAASAAGVTETFRGGEQYYVGQHVPSFLQGQAHMRQALGETSATSTKAAETTKTSWLDAMHILSTSLSTLGQHVGGVFGKLVQGVGGIVNGITAAAAGFTAFKSVTEGGLIGLIQKAAGLAGGFGGIISIATQLPGILKTAASIVTGIIKGIGDIFGMNPTTPFGGWLGSVEQSAKAGNAAAFAEMKAVLAAGKLPARYGGAALTDVQKAELTKVIDFIERGVSYGDPRQVPTGSPRPPGTPTAPRPTTEAPRTNPNPWGFQHGGWMPVDGMAQLHAGELVLPPALARDLSRIVGGQRAMMSSSTSTTDSRVLHVEVNLHGIADRDVPEQTVQAITRAIGRGYQHQAALQGNARMGR